MRTMYTVECTERNEGSALRKGKVRNSTLMNPRRIAVTLEDTNIKNASMQAMRCELLQKDSSQMFLNK